MAFPGRTESPPLREQPLSHPPDSCAVPKLHPPSPRLSTVGSASLATWLVAKRLPRSASRPSIDITSGVHVPARRPKPLRSARRCHPPRMFRPRGFSPPRRHSTSGFRACCIPKPTMGFTRFQRTDAACLPRLLAFPPVHAPSRAFPPAAAVRASPHAVAPLPFATLPGMGARLRGLAPPGSPSRLRTVAGTPPRRGSPGFPSLPSHDHRGDRAFRASPGPAQGKP